MKKALCLLVVLAMGISFISGCSSNQSASNWNPLNSGKEIKVAILGSEEQFSSYQDFFNGADMAIEEIAASGTKISYEKIDDQGNYDNAVNIATNVAKNNDYAMAVSLQECSIVGAVAYLFNENQKPLLIGNEVLTKTMTYGYAYVLSTVLLPEEQGYLAGLSAIEKGLKWITAIHSDEQCDKDFINGFQSATKESTTNLFDVREVSDSLAELKTIGTTIAAMKPDGVLVTHCNNAEYTGKLITAMRTGYNIKSKFFVNYKQTVDVRDAVKNTALTGVSSVPAYQVKNLSGLSEFSAKHEERYGTVATTNSAQGYDIMKFIIEKVEGTKSSLDFMNNAKSEEGYVGIAEYKFNKFGILVSDSAIRCAVDDSGKLTFEKIAI